SRAADPTSALASHAGRLLGDGSPAPGRHHQPDVRAASARALHLQRCGPRSKANGGARKAVEKTRAGKVPKPDFPTSLGNPANYAGFPLSHSFGGCGRLTKNGHFTCYE